MTMPEKGERKMFDRKLTAALAALIILTGCAGRPGEAPAQTQEQSPAADTGIIAQGTFPSQEEGSDDGAENAFPEGSGYSAGKGYVQASTVGTEEASAVLMEKTRQLCGLDEKDSSSDELFNALFDLMEVIDAVRVEGDYTAVLAKVKGADTEKASGLLDEIYGDGYRDGNIPADVRGPRCREACRDDDPGVAQRSRAAYRKPARFRRRLPCGR